MHLFKQCSHLLGIDVEPILARESRGIFLSAPGTDKALRTSRRYSIRAVSALANDSCCVVLPWKTCGPLRSPRSEPASRGSGPANSISLCPSSRHLLRGNVNVNVCAISPLTRGSLALLPLSSPFCDISPPTVGHDGFDTAVGDTSHSGEHGYQQYLGRTVRRYVS